MTNQVTLKLVVFSTWKVAVLLKSSWIQSEMRWQQKWSRSNSASLKWVTRKTKFETLEVSLRIMQLKFQTKSNSKLKCWHRSWLSQKRNRRGSNIHTWSCLRKKIPWSDQDPATLKWIDQSSSEAKEKTVLNTKLLKLPVWWKTKFCTCHTKKLN